MCGDAEQHQNPKRTWFGNHPAVSRGCMIVLGSIFFATSLPKAANMALALRQIEAYGFLSRGSALGVGLWVFVALELGLGTALILDYRRKLTLGTTMALLILFMVMTGHAWVQGTTEECGCFGAWLNRTPGEAFLGDAVLLVFVFLAWQGMGSRKASGQSRKAVMVVVAGLTGLVLPFCFGFSPLKNEVSPWIPLEKALEKIEIDGVTSINLEQGTHLVVLFDTGCQHCLEGIPALNTLSRNSALPPLVGLCPNGEEQRVQFAEAFYPAFAVGGIHEETFWRLMGDGDLPRVILIKAKRILKIWDVDLPDEAAVRIALSKSQG